jgi:hypothetical protein
MLILPMLLGAFRPPKPENRILPAVRTRWSRVHLFMHSNHVERACMAAENVDVADEHRKMLAVLVVGPRERSWRAGQVPALVVEKVPTALVT